MMEINYCTHFRSETFTKQNLRTLNVMVALGQLCVCIYTYRMMTLLSEVPEGLMNYLIYVAVKARILIKTKDLRAQPRLCQTMLVQIQKREDGKSIKMFFTIERILKCTEYKNI